LRVRIIFTTNELVDRTRNFTSDAFWFKPKNMEKCAAGQIFYDKKMRRRQDLSNKMRHMPYFLTKS